MNKEKPSNDKSQPKIISPKPRIIHEERGGTQPSIAPNRGSGVTPPSKK